MNRCVTYGIRVSSLALFIITACTGARSSPAAEGGAASSTAPYARCLDAIADSLVRARMQEKQVVGASVAVYQRGQFLKRTAYGFANLTTGELVTPETPFFVASITKAFSAAAVMALVEDGRLSLDAPIASIVPNSPSSWQQITVRHLLSSTSGLPGVRMYPGTMPPDYATLLDSIRGKPLNSEPGSRFQYEAPNYELLGDIINRVSGKPFDRLVTDRLLAPVGIRSARFGDHRVIRPGIAEWYSIIGVTNDWQFVDTARYVLRTDYRRYAWPGAGMFIAADDLARWIAAFADGRLVRAEFVDAIWSPTVLKDGSRFNRTFGAWSLDSTSMGRRYSTSGGARAAVTYWREGDLAVAVLTNTQGASPDALARSIATLYAGAPTGSGGLAARCSAREQRSGSK